jgi:hypothetical protein
MLLTPLQLLTLLIMKPSWWTNFSNLFLEPLNQDPSLSCSQAVSKPVWHIPLLCVQWKTPGDGQRNCPKHVELYSKNIFFLFLAIFTICFDEAISNNTCNSHKAPDFDLITGQVLQEIPTKAVVLLTTIYNSMPRLTYFPVLWKFAQIITIKKPGKPPNRVTSYMRN